MEPKTRDVRFDVLKGVATLIVVFGHVLQYSIKGYENSLIFNVIWSLQIPLFMVVSGYFSLSSKEPAAKKLGNQLVRYLWPCVTYFVVLCIAYHYENPISSAFNLLWHLEGTLWYLVVLAFLSIFSFCATKISSMTKISGGVLYSVVFFGMTVLFAIPGLKLGLTFLGIKYVLYYSLFYWLGHMWHLVKNANVSNIESVADTIFAVFSVVYFYIICNVNLYLTGDTVLEILPRLIASVCGVYIVCFAATRLKNDGKVMQAIATVGQNSLELYYIHCVLVRSLKAQQIEIVSTSGIITLVIGFLFIMGVSIGIIKLIKKSEHLYRLLFGVRMKIGN